MRFNPDDMDYVVNPYPMYRYLREHQPVHFWEGNGWVLSRHRDVERLLADPRLGRFPEQIPPGAAPSLSAALHVATKTLTGADRENHLRLRRVLGPWFTPVGVERQSQRIRQLVDRIIDELPGDEVDFVTTVADRLPPLVLSSLLGIEEIDEKTLRRFGDIIQFGTSLQEVSADLDALFRPTIETLGLLAEIVEQRRRRPQDDLISALCAAEAAGGLTADEVLPQVVSLLAAGTETTACFLTWGLLELLRHPAAMARVRSEPQLLPGALEEALRHENFGKLNHPCFAREDLVVGDVEIRRGDALYLLIGSALRDPAVFPEPDLFDITRDHARALPFGAGSHFCLGAHLARLEVRLCCGALLERFPAMELTGPPHFAPHPTIRLIDALPVRLRHAPR